MIPVSHAAEHDRIGTVVAFEFRAVAAIARNDVVVAEPNSPQMLDARFCRAAGGRVQHDQYRLDVPVAVWERVRQNLQLHLMSSHVTERLCHRTLKLHISNWRTPVVLLDRTAEEMRRHDSALLPPR